MKYHVGMRVEACSFDRGFEGAWFEGVIQSCEEGYCEVMYDKLFTTEEGDQHLVEKTDYGLLRPRPPPTNVRKWAIGDLVEANERDAWWRGVVMEVLGDRQYYVEFPESKSHNVFHQSNLRVRQDWENETWCVRSPLSLAGTRPKSFRAKFPVAKDLLSRGSPAKCHVAKGLLSMVSRMDHMDNKQYPPSVAGSCTDIVHSSLEQKDRTGHATKYRSNPKQLADEMTHRLEVKAYRSVLKVIRGRGETLTWKAERLLTKLRIRLHITNEEHLLELEKLETSVNIH